VRSRTIIGIEALGLCAGRPRVLCAGLKMISNTTPAACRCRSSSRKRKISTRILLGKRIALRGQSCNQLLRNRLKHVITVMYLSAHCALRFINPLLYQPADFNTVWTDSSIPRTKRSDTMRLPLVPKRRSQNTNAFSTPCELKGRNFQVFLSGKTLESLDLYFPLVRGGVYGLINFYC